MNNLRKVYQISMFRNELDLLELQLEENYDYIDKFIIVESSKSHSGQSKELIFDTHKHRFDKYKDKIVHLICDFDTEEYRQYKQNHINKYGFDDYVSQHEEWMREWYQRDYGILRSGIVFSDNDIVLSLDIDEIVNSKSLIEFLKINERIAEPFRLEMHFMHYYLDTNIYSTDSGLDKKWYYPTLIQYSELKRFNNSLSFLRVLAYSEQYVIKDCGWHFTFLSDAHGIAHKASIFSHSTEERFKVTSEEVENAIENLELFYEKNSVLKLRHFPVQLLPATIKNNINKWGKFIKQQSPAINTDEVLVVVAGHITDEEKKTHVINLLNNIKKDNLKVCYVTHSPKYLDELAVTTDFLHYDRNNFLINNSDYIHNADMFDESYLSYGGCTFYSGFSFGKLTSYVIAAHCPALMILFKNAIDVANTNKFKWIVFLEYDIEPPKDGFSNFIKDKLYSLTNSNKECILYPRPAEGFAYPGILLFNPDKINQHPVFLKEDWYASVRNWIKTWRLGFSETITESVLRDVFTENILEHSIEDDAKKYWSVDNYTKIHKYNSFSEGHRYMITIAPSKVNDKITLHLYITNSSDTEVDVSNITVINESTKKVVYEIKDRLVGGYEWFIDTLNNDIYDINNDVLKLEYRIRKAGTTITRMETYNLKYIDNIYNYIRRIQFN